MSKNNDLSAWMVYTPWSSDQVRSLNAFQSCKSLHPFTGARGPSGEETTLIATADGWVEREGGPVVQTWAHSVMADWTWKVMDVLPDG